MTDKKITVLKFGGSVLRNEDDLARAVHEIYSHWRHGSQVLAVISAFNGTTDALIERARTLNEDPHPEALATLLLTGEATSAALLSLALKRSGVPAKLLSPEQVGILTAGDPVDAEPISANVERIKRELEHSVVIVSGFAGINDQGDLTLLGRGGTDLTALFLARQLGARCILVKDVDGMYEADPSRSAVKPRRFARASYRTTLQLGGELVQQKAVHFAEEHGQTFDISAFGGGVGTTIGNFPDDFSLAESVYKRRLRVALLGCGTVGGGVFQRLSAMPEYFEISGVGNLDPDKALAAGIDRRLIAGDARQLIEQDCDVVIELIGGIEPAGSLIKRALELKLHVVTANKALLAADGHLLEHLARQSGVTIRYSASVGGSLPALEAVTSKPGSNKPRAIKGIINGTCNFVCDQLEAGVDLSAAIKLAQEAGFAEANPTLDLDGTDAAQKLILLARASYGVNLPFSAVARSGLDEQSPARACEAYLGGRKFRVVAECIRTANGLEASVRTVDLPASHPFALTKGAENCLLIESDTGQTRFLRGRGAGRYATTEAVMADLFDIRNAISSAPKPLVYSSFKEATP
jgi:homoserine dehydrogenase